MGSGEQFARHTHKRKGKTMSTNLYQASKQWAGRPADQRFENLAEMYAACQHHRESAATATVPLNRLRCEDRGGDVMLIGATGQAANLTHWSFGQLANRVGAPADYLRRLPANMAAANLTHGLATVDDDASARVLFHKNGSLVARCVTSDSYTRIWNADVVERLLPLVKQGWQVPPARPAFPNQPGSRLATAADVIRAGEHGLSVKVGDTIAPAGLYASDHDMFAFMVNESVRIEDGSEGGLSRGFFVSNSEVGAASLRLTKFLYRSVCGNHIVWGAKDVSELRIIHRGNADGRFASEMTAELRRYANESAGDDEQRIVAAKRFKIGATKEEVLDRLFGARILPRKSLEAAYDYAVEEGEIHAAGSPKTAWGFAQGITRLSQDTTYADKRSEIDRAAGKVLEMSF